MTEEEQKMRIEEFKRKIQAASKNMKFDMEFYEKPGNFDPKYMPKKAEDK